ncbi:hypothetical protein HPP92_001337 [Vanilla planifolia]|uniref:Uncharacterized protein n=1 Tax=Vanilla planifolia TaxID=51239 RepID=A0A835VLA3_VANPL|nr:hypothetical protein HPP92_001337 [Vanilla planifolia]
MGRGRAPCCEKVGLNKGSWTPEEDVRLISYIRKHGHGNWRALPKQAGLLRCGKSCRLRWINYLRPDLKRGNFSKEEEDTIINLHGLLGNKWSKIASCLPGRTDNEIKNVWNTHLKKRLKASHQFHPSTTPSSPSSGTTSLSGDRPTDGEVLSVDNFDIPLDSNHGMWELIHDSPLSPLQQTVDTTGVPSEVTDPVDDILGLPIEPELWGDFESSASADEKQGWLTLLEEELGLFDGGDSNEAEMDTVAEEEDGDPVRNYFHRSPSSASTMQLLDSVVLNSSETTETNS